MTQQHFTHLIDISILKPFNLFSRSVTPFLRSLAVKCSYGTNFQCLGIIYMSFMISGLNVLQLFLPFISVGMTKDMTECIVMSTWHSFTITYLKILPCPCYEALLLFQPRSKNSKSTKQRQWLISVSNGTLFQPLINS